MFWYDDDDDDDDDDDADADADADVAMIFKIKVCSQFLPLDPFEGATPTPSGGL